VTIDERVSRILTEMTEDLKPMPDPYGRVLARDRRRRRRRTATAGLIVVALLAGVAVTAGGSGGTPDEAAVSESDRNWRNTLTWSERLAKAPPRGAVARDAGYVAALSVRLLQAQHRGEMGPKTPVTAASVLFVDDVGPYRIALAAYLRADPDPSSWPHAAVWLVANRGAGVEELGAAAAVWQSSDALEPYESVAPDNYPSSPRETVHVAIAPQGCTFESAALPELIDWKPEPTGSYLVRTAQAARPEWWRVTCDGVVREMRPGPGSLAPDGITDTQLAQAVARARGTVDTNRLREVVWISAQSWGYGVAELPSVVWAGRTAGTRSLGLGPSFDGLATVLAAPAVGSGWVGEVELTYDKPTADGSTGAGGSFRTEADPTDPSTVVAIPFVNGNTAALLVIAPPGTASVTAARDGKDIASAAVKDAAALLAVPIADGVTVRATDARGRVLATGEVAEAGGPRVAVSRWHED
jgi:hypothetical protein